MVAGEERTKWMVSFERLGFLAFCILMLAEAWHFMAFRL